MAQATEVQQRYGRTQRLDRWWFEPALLGGGLLIFVIYSTVSALLLGNSWSYEAGPYLSPFFEPLIRPGWVPTWISPAVFILWAPLGFRTTCYYYRKAYYRSYLFSPPACAVTEPAKSYSGESKFPLILQNAHRFFLYVALLFIPILWYGAVKSFWLEGEGFGVGVGSLILVANAFLLMMFTLSCNSLRHIVGGGLNCFSCTAVTRSRRRVWEIQTLWNEHHRGWAWTSLISVGLADLYVHLVASGAVTDINTWTNF